MLTEVRRLLHEHSENFNKEIEYIRKYQTEITELKNTEKFNRAVQQKCKFKKTPVKTASIKKIKDKKCW